MVRPHVAERYNPARHEEQQMEGLDRGRLHRVPVLRQPLDGRVRTLRNGTEEGPAMGAVRRLHNFESLDRPGGSRYWFCSGGVLAGSILKSQPWIMRARRIDRY